MKKRYLLLAYISILIAYSLPLTTRIAEESGAHVPKVPSFVAPLHAEKSPRVDSLKIKAIKAVRSTQNKPVYHISGSCTEWLAQAGIPINGSVMALIHGESGCNPNSRNTSSGACGIAQELPCGKSGCGLGNPVCQLRWMDGYVKSRYGSWDNAYATWLSRSPHWY